ncbi:hypothetical protein F5Y13DRAFT_104329 [Hypoxylon sp. FL1857]|nr:hypothetical protein F5Y13DRAFT_104329 [Hypoxylon sp. FL1857]
MRDLVGVSSCYKSILNQNLVVVFIYLLHGHHPSSSWSSSIFFMVILVMAFLRLSFLPTFG